MERFKKEELYDLNTYGKSKFLGWDSSGGIVSAEFRLLDHDNTIIYLNLQRLKELGIIIHEKK